MTKESFAENHSELDNVPVENDNTPDNTPVENTEKETTKSLLDKADSKEGETEKEPASYDDLEFDLPEGMKLDEDFLSNAVKQATESNISKEAFKNLVDLHIKHTQDLQSKFQDSKIAENNKLIEDYNALAEQDKDIGGANLKQNLNNAVEVIKKIGGDELLGLLKDNPLGSHPAVIKAFSKLHKDIISPNNFDQGSTATLSDDEKVLIDAFPNIK